MAIEKCEHPYFKLIDGELRCVKCNRKSDRYKVEDKAQAKGENKRGIYIPPESKRT